MAELLSQIFYKLNEPSLPAERVHFHGQFHPRHIKRLETQQTQDPRLDPLYQPLPNKQTVARAESFIDLLQKQAILKPNHQINENINFQEYDWNVLAEGTAKAAFTIGAKDLGNNPLGAFDLFKAALSILDQKRKDPKLSQAWQDRIDYLEVKTLSDFAVVIGESGASGLRRRFLSVIENHLLDQGTRNTKAEQKWFGELMNNTAFVYAQSGNAEKATSFSTRACAWYQKMEEQLTEEQFNDAGFNLYYSNSLRRKFAFDLLTSTYPKKLKKSYRKLKGFYAANPEQNGPLFREHLLETILLQSVSNELATNQSPHLANLKPENIDNILLNIRKNLASEFGTSCKLDQTENGLWKFYYQKKELPAFSEQINSLYRLKNLLQLLQATETDPKQITGSLQGIWAGILLEIPSQTTRLSRRLLNQQLQKLIEQPDKLTTQQQKIIADVDLRTFFKPRNFDSGSAKVAPAVRNLNKLAEEKEAISYPPFLVNQVTNAMKIGQKIFGLQYPWQIWRELKERLFQAKPEGLFVFQTATLEQNLRKPRELINEFNNSRVARRNKLLNLIRSSNTPESHYNLVFESLRELPGIKVFAWSKRKAKSQLKWADRLLSHRNNLEQARKEPDQFHLVEKKRLYFLTPHVPVDGKLTLEWLEEFIGFLEDKGLSFKTETEDREDQTISFGEEKLHTHTITQQASGFLHTAAFLLSLRELTVEAPKHNHKTPLPPAAMIPAATEDLAQLSGITFVLSKRFKNQYNRFIKQEIDNQQLQEELKKEINRYKQLIRIGFTHGTPAFRLANAVSKVPIVQEMGTKLAHTGLKVIAALFDQPTTLSTLKTKLPALTAFATCPSKTAPRLNHRPKQQLAPGLDLGILYTPTQTILTLRANKENSYYSEEQFNYIVENLWPCYERILTDLTG